MAILQVKDIKKSFADNLVLKGIDFELNKGEVLVIIGSSGSGKTTLLRCLNFLETPDFGKIIVNDEVLFDTSLGKINNNDAEIRNKRLHFGLVFQSFNLFPQYNVLQNVELALNLLTKSNLKDKIKIIKKERKKLLFKTDIKSITERKKLTNNIKEIKKSYKELENKNREIAKQIIIRVGLEDKLQAYPCELSGGQCQRVAIARALALKPDILCFDEPTSALDPELTGEVLKVIRELKDSDSTMIVVTHEMEFAKNVADKVIYMADGVIEEMGTPDEVFNHPKSPKTIAFLNNSLELMGKTIERSVEV